MLAPIHKATLIRSVATLAALALVLSNRVVSLAEECVCAHCGCYTECDKICRLVEEEKKLTVTCWGGKCEDFCVPGPSEKKCEHCEVLCKENPEGEPHCAHVRKTAWSTWAPWICPTIYTKTKLMKKTVTKKIPSYKWVVEDLCPKCESKAESAKPKDGADVPEKPKDGKEKGETKSSDNKSKGRQSDSSKGAKGTDSKSLGEKPKSRE